MASTSESARLFIWPDKLRGSRGPKAAAGAAPPCDGDCP